MFNAFSTVFFFAMLSFSTFYFFKLMLFSHTLLKNMNCLIHSCIFLIICSCNNFILTQVNTNFKLINKINAGSPHKCELSAFQFYIQATLFILKRQNPLSSPIFSFKAFQDFLQGLGLLSLSSLLSLDIPLFSRLSPWF